MAEARQLRGCWFTALERIQGALGIFGAVIMAEARQLRGCWFTTLATDSRCTWNLLSSHNG